MNVPETESEDPLCLTGTFRVQLQSTLNKETYLANFVCSVPECLGPMGLAPRISERLEVSLIHQ